jgi:hypothetical protein
MTNIIRCTVVALTVALSSSIQAAPPTGSDPLTECHRVFSEVGLIVRASASSKGKKIGRLEKGAKVMLDGEELSGTGAVYPMMKKDSEGGYWIKIKSPQEGYVLYTSEDDTDYTYIVPCKR